MIRVSKSARTVPVTWQETRDYTGECRYEKGVMELDVVRAIHEGRFDLYGLRGIMYVGTNNFAEEPHNIIATITGIDVTVLEMDGLTFREETDV